MSLKVNVSASTGSLIVKYTLNNKKKQKPRSTVKTSKIWFMNELSV